MRLKNLNLVRFGKFTDTDISLPKSEHDFHFIIGPNEAGIPGGKNVGIEDSLVTLLCKLIDGVLAQPKRRFSERQVPLP